MHQPSAISLTHAGAQLVGQLVVPAGDGKPAPAVLVMHDAMGLGEFAVERARRLAAQGYVALAADMYGGGAHSEDPDEAGKHFIQFHRDPALVRARTLAWFARIRELPEVDPGRTAAIGFCFGGQCVLELARSGAGVKAVVSYHGLLTTPAPAAADSLSTQVTVYTGRRDPYAPVEDVDALRKEMTAAGATLQLTEFSDAYHAFTNPNPPRGVDAGMKYDEVCDRVSWAGTIALLESVLA